MNQQLFTFYELTQEELTVLSQNATPPKPPTPPTVKKSKAIIVTIVCVMVIGSVGGIATLKMSRDGAEASQTTYNETSTFSAIPFSENGFDIVQKDGEYVLLLRQLNNWLYCTRTYK